jgi:hypothetical protein
MEKLDVDHLKCQVVGCNAPWTVNAGWKKCSKHAWSENRSDLLTKTPIFDRPPVKPFVEVDDHEVY